VTTTELLTTIKHLGITLQVDGDRLKFGAPAGALTPELKDEMVKHKPALLAVLAPVAEYITLAGGLPLPVPALRLAWDLEARGFPLHTDADHQFIVPNDSRLTDIDIVAIQRWRLHLGAIVEYEAPEIA